MPISETVVPGAVIVEALKVAADTLTATARTDLDSALAAVLTDFFSRYETETDIPECPSCDSGYPCSHAEETYHVQCGEAVAQCACITPYLTLARTYQQARATRG